MLVGDVGNWITQTLWVMTKIATPALMCALVIGVVLSLFQTLTQIQEQSVTFIPKLIGVFAVLLWTSSFIYKTLLDFSKHLFDQMTRI